MTANRTFLTLAFALGALATPGVASAADLCVNHAACAAGGGTPIGDLSAALSVANAAPDADTVHLGGGAPYAGNFLVGTGTHLKGASFMSTVLEQTDPAKTTTLTVNGGRVSGVTVKGRDTSATAGVLHLSGGAVAESVSVSQTDGTGGAPAVTLADSTIRDSRSWSSPDGDGVAAWGASRVQRMQINAGTGVRVDGPKAPDVVVEDSWIRAVHQGVLVQKGFARFEDSAVRLAGPSTIGLHAKVSGSTPAPVTVDAHGLTISGGGAPSQTGIRATAAVGPDLVVGLQDSIIAGTGKPIVRLASEGARADVLVDRSNHGPLGAGNDANSLGGKGAVTISNPVAGTPQFADADNGDLRLVAGSPLVDAGSAFSTGTDADGLERVLDGNGDGVAARDLGAYERQPAPLVVGKDQPVDERGTARNDTPVQRGGAFVIDPVDRTRPVLSRLSVKRGTRRLVGSFRLSESATVVVRLQRVRGARTIGRTLKLRARVGVNRMTLPLRRRVGRGPFRLTVTVVDVAGNRGTTVRRVVSLERR